MPFTRLMSRADLFGLLADSLYIEPREKLEESFRGVIDRLFAEPDCLPEAGRVSSTLKRLLNQLFPPGAPSLSLTARRRIAERSAKAIYIHSHMDEETFDAGRVMKCCVGVPAADGTNIPTCSYNVLYREQDPRFASKEMLARMNRSRQAEPQPREYFSSSNASISFPFHEPPEKTRGGKAGSPWRSESAGKPLLLTRIFNPKGIAQ